MNNVIRSVGLWACVGLAACGGGSKKSSIDGGGTDAGSTDAAVTDAGQNPTLDGGTTSSIVASSVLTAHDRIGGAAVDSTYLYFIERGDTSGAATSFELRRIPLAGGPAEDLADQGGAATAIALVDDTVFFCRADGIFAAPKAGGALRTVVTGDGFCPRRAGTGGPAARLLPVGTDLYFMPSTSAVAKVAQAGGAMTTVLSDTSVGGAGFFDVAASGSTLYASTLAALQAYALDGSSPRTLTSLSTVTAQLSVVGDAVLYLDGTLESVPTSGGSATVLAYTPHGVTDYAIDGAVTWLLASNRLYEQKGPGALPVQVAANPNGTDMQLFLAPGLVLWVQEEQVTAFAR